MNGVIPIPAATQITLSYFKIDSMGLGKGPSIKNRFSTKLQRNIFSNSSLVQSPRTEIVIVNELSEPCGHY